MRASTKSSAATLARLRPEVLAWLVPHHQSTVLDLGSGSGALARALAAREDQVFALDADARHIARLAEAIPTGRHVVAQAESLPFAARSFEAVTAFETLHRFAPGLVVSEVARVLKPGGHLATAYTMRDDTVPWVKRFAELVRTLDDTAMQGAWGQDSVQAIYQSPYFLDVDERSFRAWVPVTRSQLINMVISRPAIRGGDAEADAAEAVGAIYDEVARTPDSLSLPFRTTCWRAQVDPDNQPITDGPTDLQFRL